MRIHKRNLVFLLTLLSISIQLWASEMSNYKPPQIDIKALEKEYAKDTDKDGLPDRFEEYLGTNSIKMDTDEDKLPDGYEYYILCSDPSKKDSNSNKISDAEEDFDKDGLSNLQEYILKTAPLHNDTDNDNLNDKEECKYKSIPCMGDTDKDDLLDGDEVLLKFDPIKPDTDGDKILDSKEKVYQTLAQSIIQEESPAVIQVKLSAKIEGKISDSIRIENTYNIDILSTEVVGLVGVPVDICTDKQLDQFKITFVYNKNLLRDTREEDLAIMWYDEDDPWYNVLESTVDIKNHAVTITSKHLGTYLLVDKKKWNAAWAIELDYSEKAD